MSIPINSITSSYRAADMEIMNRSADLHIDLRKVWNSMGLENPLDYMRSKNTRIVQESVEGVAQKARDGDRIARSVQNKVNNVFGDIAHDKFLRIRKVETVLTLMPSARPEITITTYRPEIHIEPHIPALRSDGSSMPIIVQPVVSQSAGSIDMRL